MGRAMVSDVAEVLHDMSGVDSLVVCGPEHEGVVRTLVWADVPVVSAEPADVMGALHIVAGRGYSDVVIVAADTPDLPQMILAKMFQALATSSVAVAPAHGGGAVAIGAALPAPAWLTGLLAHADLDAPTIVDDLRATAVRQGSVRVTPGWHRVRTADDVRRLDPGLEGWESTRSLLAATFPGDQGEMVVK